MLDAYKTKSTVSSSMENMALVLNIWTIIAFLFCFSCDIDGFGIELTTLRSWYRGFSSNVPSKKIPTNSKQLYVSGLAEDDGKDDDDILPEGMSSTDNSIDDLPDDDYDDVLTISTKMPSMISTVWEIGNCFDQFINQCTIQSFLYLLKTCHDPQTVLWLENFTQPSIDPIRTPAGVRSSDVPASTTSHSKLLTYHGLSAMNLTAFPRWDTYFYQLLEQPKVLYSIESYQSYVPTYDLEINPSSLCTRLISVREQIAREFSHDLRVLCMMNVRQLMLKYESGSNETSQGSHSGPSRFTLASDETLFLDSWDATDGEYAMPSPLREGNFDLLLLLITQESIHRMLNDRAKELFTEYDVGTMSKSDVKFLSSFYLNRVVSHFTGRQPYGRANHFLQELITQSPSDGEYGPVNPQHIVQYILSTRQQVAREWSLHSAKVSDFHIDIKRAQFSALMKSYDSPSSFTDNSNCMQ